MKICGASDRNAERTARIRFEHVLRGLHSQRALFRNRRHRRSLVHERRVAVHVETIERDQTCASFCRAVDDSARHGQQQLVPLEIKRIHAIVDGRRAFRCARYRIGIADIERNIFHTCNSGRSRRATRDANAMSLCDEAFGNERTNFDQHRGRDEILGST